MAEGKRNDLPVVILSDLNMPGKNGYDIIAGIKATPAYRHIPAIITATSSTKSFIDKGMAFGAAAYLVKPGTFVEYVPFVHKVHSTIEENALVS